MGLLSPFFDIRESMSACIETCMSLSSRSVSMLCETQITRTPEYLSSLCSCKVSALSRLNREVSSIMMTSKSLVLLLASLFKCKIFAICCTNRRNLCVLVHPHLFYEIPGALHLPGIRGSDLRGIPGTGDWRLEE
jgi:hypothetical protein